MYKTQNQTTVNIGWATATMIADSINGDARLSTIELVYPRIIHAEVLRHRVFSNAVSSSRATPVERIIADATFCPENWTSAQKGMVGGKHLQGEKAKACTDAWLESRDCAIRCARKMLEAGAHKQHINRILEPYSFVRHLITATDWENFFNLRLAPDADPTIQQLAQAMDACFDNSKPLFEKYHLPYLTEEERLSTYISIETKFKMSSARSARVSHLRHDQKTPCLEDDLRLYDETLFARNHFTPFEHCAKAGDPSKRYANFTGWMSHRFMIGE